MLYRKIPFLRLIIPLCAGIITGLRICPGTAFSVIAVSLTVLLFCASLFFSRYLTNVLYGIALCIALWFAGLLLYTLEKDRITPLSPDEAIFAGTLEEIPEEKENTWKMLIRLKGFISGDSLRPAGGSLLIYHRKEGRISSFLPGDQLLIRCRPEKIRNMGNPSEFDYSFYMERKGIRYLSFTDSTCIIARKIPERRKMKHSALIIRERILEIYRERGVSEKRLGLVAAMTLGQKNLLDPEQKLYFIRAGVMHIMAVSGLHTVILSLFVFKMLFFLKGRMNILRIIITLTILWVYAFVTGLTPSVLRATLMYSFLQAGKAMRRDVNSVNSVLASAFVLILIRPSVIFDAGFLLSYSAVIFIICFYRDLYLKLNFRHRIPRMIWESAAVTITAQTGTLPLTVMMFNRFPVWFILSNIIIVPLASLVIVSGALTIFFYPLPFLSRITGGFLEFITGLTETLTETAASLPLSTIENIGIGTAQCILLSISLFLLLKYLLDRKSVRAAFPLSFLLLFITAGTIKDISTRRSGEIIVYNTAGHTTIGIRAGKHLNSYTATLITLKEVERHKAMAGLKETKNLIKDNTLLKTGYRNVKNNTADMHILITERLTDSLLEAYAPDIIVLRGRNPLIEDKINLNTVSDISFESSGNYTPANASTYISVNKSIRALVISPELQRRSGIKIPNADTVHYVRTSGAFRLSL
ncbi:MAG TPA: ComEC/Rec2 family competence protein [Bacteroidales bacterium]|nr:ComEC/Rec2 family competence protein [Bacteroidales bacterium]HQJ83528.1 ComEC/Rec2 family competence protein [Bacteroidales bacterium]